MRENSTTTSITRSAIALLPLLLALLAGCKSPPYAPDPGAQARVDALLVQAEDKDSLSTFVGVVPTRCMPSSPASELCEWQAGDRERGWSEMAQAIGTDDRVNLICELPTSREPRALGSCSIHPRRSNRYSWEVPTSPSRNHVKEGYRQSAARWMEEADTLAGLSRLMGALPNECERSDDDHRLCTWHTTNQTFGQGTLVVWIGASKRQKIRLRCVLPNDGGPREPDSCRAEIGA
jgi:hypothetical protein